MTEKVYKPIEISDNPLPGETETSVSSSQPKSGGVYSAGKTKDNAFPVKKIAMELMSVALNTKSRKILAEFEFTEHGAIQIGKYDNGVTGDLRITPSGITARDKAGITTFAIDGETGSAVFKGSIRAGSLMTGGSIVGGDININDVFTVDNQGNMVASSATFGQYLSKAGTSQALAGDIQVGNGNVKIDGANKRIIINDGSNDRILIGYQSGGF